MSDNVTLPVATPIGLLDVTLSPQAIQRIDFNGVAPVRPTPETVAPLFNRFRTQLERYFKGKRKDFDLPFAPFPGGTIFQHLVWNAIGEIPYGEVISYSDLAVWAGKPKAVRAAASACGANRIPILIPCHRVVGKRNLGGYGGGLAIKKALLALECSLWENQKSKKRGPEAN